MKKKKITVWWTVKAVIKWTFLVAMCVFTLYPVFYAVIGSFKTNAELTLGNALFPEQWHYENYIYAFQQLDFGLYTFNSVALALLTVVLSVLTSSMAGYVIGRRQFVGKKLLTGMYLASMFISVGSVALYPLYKLLNGLGLTSNLMGLALMVVCFVAGKLKGFGQNTTPFNFRNFIHTFADSFLALLMPVIILGGIYGGIFTPTEAAAVACIYGLIVGYFVYHGFKLKELFDIAFESAKTTGMIFFIIATASIFSWILATEQVPAMISNAVLSLTSNKVIILLIINVLLLINGCFMEMTASTYIYTPILLPMILSLGMDPIHFGVVMVMNMAIGFITPPLGIHLFVGVGLDKRVVFNDLVKNIIPMFLALVVVLMFVTYIPELSMFLVNIMGS